MWRTSEEGSNENSEMGLIHLPVCEYKPNVIGADNRITAEWRLL